MALTVLSPKRPNMAGSAPRKLTIVSVLALIMIIPLCAAQNNKPVECTIKEAAPAFTEVVDIVQELELYEVYEADVLDSLRFSFRSTTGPAQYFTIDADTGIIRTNQKIDHETVCPYSETCELDLDVIMRPLEYFQIIKVAVRVEDINDNVPTFPIPSGTMRLDIAETTMPGAMFSIPSAEDMDSGMFAVQKYEMRGDVDKFELKVTDHFDGSKDVRLVLKEKLDRETEDHYAIEIVATDGGDPPESGRLSVDITVSDANDNNPRFDNYTYEAQIYENLPAGTTIIRVHARDPDSGPNGQVVYSLAPHTEDDYGNLFGIEEESGEVYIKGTVDFEEENVYHLTVMASDLGPNSLPAFTKVTIHVLDKNDHAPQITINALTSSGVGQVMENEPVDTFVAHVAVADPDLGINGEFSCGILGKKFRLQQLYGHEYKIITNAVFDRERLNEEMVTLQCSDKGRPPQTSTKHLKVDIVDANDHTPVLPKAPYFAFLKENNTVNDVIIKINATDLDTGKNAAIKYRLEGLADTPSNLVSMDLISGEIRAKAIFDHEKRQQYQFLIIAHDQADEPRTATATLNLTITDENDEYPVFSQRSYSFEMNENEPPNTRVGAVHATDGDSYPYNKILYSIDTLKSNTDAFDIDTESGKIITNRPLDREVKGSYHLVIVASNEGFAHINATVNVTVYVRDKNDNAPTILYPTPKNNTIPISNRVPKGFLVTRVEALDRDLSENARLSYEIANGNDDNLFAIDRLTGALSVAAESFKKIDYQRMKLVIIVKDHGQPEKISIADLNVEVDRNVAFEAASAQTGPLLLEGSNLMILIGAIAGFIIVVIVIVITVFCLRARRRRIKKAHQYNCRLEAKSKSLSNGSITKEGLHSSSNSCSENGSEQSIDTVHVIGLKTKERVKKEVTFSLDMDDAFIDKIPANWPLRPSDSKVIENPHAQRPAQGPPPAKAETSQPAAPRPLPRPAGAHERTRRPHPAHPDRRAPHGASAWVQEQAQARAANGDKPVHLTEGDLEMHDMLNLSQNTDHDSESGCSGSYTDSGRGPSEEGDNFVMHDPFYPGESKNGNAAKSDPPNISPGKETDISPTPPAHGKTHMNIPHVDSPSAPIGGANLRLKTFAPLPRGDANAHHRDAAGVVNNLNKDSEVNGNRLPPYPSNCVHSNTGNGPRWPTAAGEGKTRQYNNGGYEPSPNANKLKVLDRPSYLANQGGHGGDNAGNANTTTAGGKKKGVRFAETPSVMVAQRSCPLAQDEDYASSVEALSDDGTTTSGSYVVSDGNMDMDIERGVRLGGPNEGTVV